MSHAGGHPTQNGMHAEHLAFDADHEQWLADVTLWRRQTAALVRTLGAIGAELRKHEERLCRHAWQFPRHSAVLHGHDHSIAELQAAGAGEQYDPSTPTHAEWSRRHADVAAEHEELKGFHRTVVAKTRNNLEQIFDGLGDVT